MSENSNSQNLSKPEASEQVGIPNPFTELVTSFRELKDAPRGFWYTNYIYWPPPVMDSCSLHHMPGYTAELAPEGQTGAYIAFANLPWFMIKFIAGWYTGRMMDIYCPAEGVQNTETMWLIYGLIAMISPVALVLARRWVSKGINV